MARERITFPVNLRQNINDDSTAFGKWFPVPSTSEPMSLKGFAKHLSEHGKLASYDMLVLVLQNIVGCLKELILQGQAVKLDGLGTFRPTIEGKGSNDVETAVSQGANVIIEGVHRGFRELFLVNLLIYITLRLKLPDFPISRKVHIILTYCFDI